MELKKKKIDTDPSVIEIMEFKKINTHPNGHRNLRMQTMCWTRHGPKAPIAQESRTLTTFPLEELTLHLNNFHVEKFHRRKKSVFIVS